MTSKGNHQGAGKYARYHQVVKGPCTAHLHGIDLFSHFHPEGFSENMEAAKHSVFLRGYYKKKDKEKEQQKKAAEENKKEEKEKK